MSRRILFAVAATATVVSAVAGFHVARASGYPNPDPGRSTTVSLVAGSYVIDAGVVTGAATVQTKDQALKPFGLIYALVKAQIPVQWIIKPSKASPGANVNAGGIDQSLGNVGVDLVYDCDDAGGVYAPRSIVTGAFVIAPQFVAQAKGVSSIHSAVSMAETRNRAR